MVVQVQELPYRIEMWDDHDTHVEELIALVGDHAVARSAFAEAVRRRPGKVSLSFARSRGCSLTAEGGDRPHAQNPERGSNNNAKEAPGNAQGIPRCVRRAREASAHGGSLSGGRNGVTTWHHERHLQQV